MKLKLTQSNRKFVVALLALMMTFTLSLLGKLSDMFVDVVAIIVGVFTTGNVMEHLKEVWKK